jgi:hypothetical protein
MMNKYKQMNKLTNILIKCNIMFELRTFYKYVQTHLIRDILQGTFKALTGVLSHLLSSRDVNSLSP